MKSLMRNTVFSALLAAPALVASAQQGTATLPTLAAPVAPVTGQLAPLRAIDVTGSDNHYYYSDRQIADSNLKSKEVSKEISTPRGADIYIENTSGSIIVKTWAEQKVKVTTTVYYAGEPKFTDEEWMERANLSLKTLGNSVKIKSGSGTNRFVSYNNSAYTVISGNATYSIDGQNSGRRSTVKRVITITIPTGSKIDVESKYSDIQLPSGIGDAYIDITNGNLEAENLNKLILRAKYSNANVGDVKTAELEFTNGRFSAKNIDDLDVESKYSTIEMAAAKKLVLRSTNDEFEIEEAGEVRGRKNYGNLRITKLNNSIELDGANADVKIRNAGAALSQIKIDNRYADIRIPLREVKNYSLDFSGNYSSVYGNFEKVPYTPTEKEKTDKAGSSSSASGVGTAIATTAPSDVVVVSGRTVRPAVAWGGRDSNSPAHFTAKVGSGQGLKIDLKCQNCTVDFK
jgi:hypothetical protein